MDMDEPVPLVLCAVPECKTSFASWVGHRRCFSHSPCITEAGLYDPTKCTAQCYEMNNEESVIAQLASAGTSRMDEHLEQPLKGKKTFIHGTIPKAVDFNTGAGFVKTASCNICGTGFDNLAECQAFDRHYMDHFGVKYHLCVVCDRTFDSMKKLNKHLSEHIFKDGSTCNVCGKVFSVKNLKQHSLKHSLVAPHWCFVCGKAFTQIELLETHFINHGDQLPSAGTSRMNEHLEQPWKRKKTFISGTIPKADDFNTGAGFVKTVYCEICGTSFNNPAESLAFERHYMDHFGVNDYLCVICDKTFNNKKKLKKHQSKHMTDFTCNVCDKVFSDVQNLKQHSITHSLVAPYWCFVCGKAFTKIELLKTHFINHGAFLLKPYTCSKCNKVLPSLKDLNTHELNYHGHIEVKRYCCDVCGTAFTQESELTKHYENHLKKKYHICNVCGKAFTKEEKFKIHSLSHTKENKKWHTKINRNFKRHSTFPAEGMFVTQILWNELLKGHGPD